ncbi:MAG: tetratricopeptide repeat protein [Firmicutes bacterium]|nr:tetratricopeptide repeat protein [Bacillota bacterium]
MRIENTDHLFQKIRDRMKLESEMLSEDTNLDLRTLERNQDYKHSTQIKSVKKLVEPFFDTGEMLTLPYQHEQERLSNKAVFALQNNESTSDIRQIITQALAETNADENDYINKPLIAFEPQLFHILAMTYAKDNDMDTAITILKNVLDSVEAYPPDDRTKEVQVTPMLLTLARYLLQVEDYESALATCNIGFNFAVRRNQGKYCPDFMHIEILIHIATGNKEACHPLLAKTFAGYVGLNNAKAANEILTIAHKQLDMPIATYGMELILHDMPPDTPVAQPQRNITTLGDMLQSFMGQTSFKRKVIYGGLCDSSALTKLEMNKTKSPNIFLVEALAQRMGRDIGLHHSFHAPAKEFKTWQLRDKIQVLMRERKFTQAGKQLEELKLLESKKRYQHVILRQFTQLTEARIYGRKHSKDNEMPEYLEMLTVAIRLTIPGFDERDDIANYPLTMQEAVTINCMAAYYHYKGDHMHAERMYRKLFQNIEAHWKDDTLKSQLCGNLSFNHSSCLGLLN